MSVSSPPIPVAFAPAAETVIGIGYSLDRPFNDRLRAYVSLRIDP